MQVCKQRVLNKASRSDSLNSLMSTNRMQTNQVQVHSQQTSTRSITTKARQWGCKSSKQEVCALASV
jgi:hypothetical protein